jgi:hypothetical protein
MPSNIFSAHLASTIPAVVSWWLPRWQWTAEIADMNGLSLQRRAPLPFQRALQSYRITIMPSNIFSAHLASTIPAVVSWWLPRWRQTADCRNCRLERLEPPAQSSIPFQKSFTSLIASLPCPATSSVPTWLLQYLQWSHGACLDDGGLQKFQI